MFAKRQLFNFVLSFWKGWFVELYFAVYDFDKYIPLFTLHLGQNKDFGLGIHFILRVCNYM